MAETYRADWLSAAGAAALQRKSSAYPRPRAQIRAPAEHGYAGHAHSYPGTRPGTLAETARRRMVVEDLRKAGLSIRAISAGTGIPRSSVHRAMAAIVRAQAKQEVAIAEMAKEFLGKRLSRRG